MASSRRTGSADLPLHGGNVPPWLAQRMTRLGRVITEALVHHYGRGEFLRRLADPFWFQSLGAVMGMDWHSSGITTSVMGALKRGLAPLQDELGIFICGGRGRHSRATPDELLAVGHKVGLDGVTLARHSRLTAKVDSAAVQDGFSIYLHSFIVDRGGDWVVVQQGMNPAQKQARRYHWLSHGLKSFVETPHSAIEGESQGQILNLTDRRARNARTCEVELANQGPDMVVDQLRRLRHLQLPRHHEIQFSDVMLRRLHGTLALAADQGVPGFEELLLTPGVGPRTVQALALVSEVIHGAASRFDDPARFAFAHGGKDGHPFPVPLKVYDQTLGVMRRALDHARLGQEDRLAALKSLEVQARLIERVAGGASFEAIIAEERRRSHSFGGRSVFGMAQRAPSKMVQGEKNSASRKSKQLTLPKM